MSWRLPSKTSHQESNHHYFNERFAGWEWLKGWVGGTLPAYMRASVRTANAVSANSR